MDSVVNPDPGGVLFAVAAVADPPELIESSVNSMEMDGIIEGEVAKAKTEEKIEVTPEAAASSEPEPEASNPNGGEILSQMINGEGGTSAGGGDDGGDHKEPEENQQENLTRVPSSADLNDDSSSSSSQEPNSEKEQPSQENSASLCDFCKLSFSTSSDLVQHMTQNHPTKPLRPCTTCQKTFSSLASLESHRCPLSSCPSSSSSSNSSNPQSPSGADSDLIGGPALEEDSLPPSPSITKPPEPSSTLSLPYHCTICPDKFANPHLLKKHMSSHNKRYHCTLCSHSFNNMDGLNLHKRLIHDSQKMSFFKCLICGKGDFLLLSDLYDHRKDKHLSLAFQGDKEKPFGCGICQKPCNRRGDALVCAVLGHRETGLMEKMSKFQCADCQEGYHSKRALKEHEIKEHGNLEEDLGIDEELPVVTIDKREAYELREKGTEEPGLILEFPEIQIPEGTGPCEIPVFCCPDCPLSFVDNESLRLHENLHLQNEGPPQPTPEKKRGRPAGSSLQKILKPISLISTGFRGHHLVPKFDCKVCGKKFRKLKRLREHEQVHRNMDPTCPIFPKVGGRKPGGILKKKKKPLLSRRGRPKKMASAERDWEETSGSGGEELGDFLQERSFKCGQCPAAFVSEKSLRMHQLQIHKAPHRKPGRKPGIKGVKKEKEEQAPLPPGRIRVGRLEISTKFNKMIKQNQAIKICVTGEDGQSTFHFQCPLCPKVFKDKRGIHLHIVGHGLKEGEGDKGEEAGGIEKRRTSERERKLPRKLSEYEVEEEEEGDSSEGKWRKTPPHVDYYGDGVDEQEPEEEEEEMEELEWSSDEEEEMEEKPPVIFDKPTCKICLKSFESVTELWYHGNQEHFKSTKVKYVPKKEEEKVKKVVKPKEKVVEATRKVYEGFGRKNPAVLALLEKKRKEQQMKLEEEKKVVEGTEGEGANGGEKIGTLKLPQDFNKKEVLNKEKPEVIHQQNENGEMVKMYKCPKCPKTFRDKRGFPFHAICHLVMAGKKEEEEKGKKDASTRTSGAGIIKEVNIKPAEENAGIKPALSPTSNEFRFKIIKQSRIEHCEEEGGNGEEVAEVKEGIKEKKGTLAAILQNVEAKKGAAEEIKKEVKEVKVEEATLKRKRGRPRKDSLGGGAQAQAKEVEKRRVSGELSIVMNGEIKRTVEGTRLEGIGGEAKEPQEIPPEQTVKSEEVPEASKEPQQEEEEAPTPPPPRLLQMIKRKGRPPKSPRVSGSPEVPISKPSPPPVAPVPAPDLSEVAPPTLKRKSRPPKYLEESIVEIGTSSNADARLSSESPEVPVKRSRGRPRKTPEKPPTLPEAKAEVVKVQPNLASPDIADFVACSASPTAPVNVNPSPEVEDQEEQMGNPPKRKRGRPRKSMPVLTAAK